MKILMMTILFLSFGSQSFAGAKRQRQLDKDHIINKVNRAITTVEEMSERHEVLTKEEILVDIKNFIDSKKASVSRDQRDSFLADAQIFVDLVNSKETVSDILLLEQDLITELNEFEYSAYMDATSQVGGEGAIIGLVFSLPYDLVAAPFQAIYNETQYNQTKWSRETLNFLINYL